MMITGWIKSMISAILPEQVSQGAQTFEKKVKPKLHNLTEGVPDAEALQKKSGDFLAKVRKGGSVFDRFRFRLQAKRKVKKNLDPIFGDDSEIIDEVTEKIIKVAKDDPRYRRLFG